MRLFVAFDLDDRARDALSALQARLAPSLGADASLRWTKATSIHLTLAFLGEQADGRVPAIAAALSSVLDTPPFSATLEGLGVFPPRGAPRVLWLGVSAGAEAVVAVHTEVTQRLESVGVALEGRPFSPHLTLARWPRSRPADRARALAADQGQPIARLDVDAITLYESRRSAAGARYVALARATLT